jgi:hypothetical protein
VRHTVRYSFPNVLCVQRSDPFAENEVDYDRNYHHYYYHDDGGLSSARRLRRLAIDRRADDYKDEKQQQPDNQWDRHCLSREIRSESGDTAVHCATFGPDELSSA